MVRPYTYTVKGWSGRTRVAHQLVWWPAAPTADAPPPLSSLTEQVEAVRLRENVDASSVVHSAAAVDESLRVANVVVMAPKAASK